jgi:hypothetical protein
MSTTQPLDIPPPNVAQTELWNTEERTGERENECKKEKELEEGRERVRILLVSQTW